ncbi:MAG: hypothetical protein ACXWEN_09505 [Actinomycetota bacterium]
MTPKQRKAKASPSPRAKVVAPSKKKWIATYYKDATCKVPARDALRTDGFLKNVRLALEARAMAVRDAPPPSFPAGSLIWSAMSKDREKGKVDMSGIFEIRDKQGDTLYRLFCVLDSDGESHGLEAPALVMLSLATKPVRTAMPQAVYRRVRAEADRYFATTPRPVVLPPGV